MVGKAISASGERRPRGRRASDRGDVYGSLQLFGYRHSQYPRPNLPWVCGRTAEGAPCQVGPDTKGRCLASFECRPQHAGQTYVCTRSMQAGGKCEQGPMPDGTCSRPVPRCRPVRSWRARRGVTVRWVCGTLVGLLLASLAGPSAPMFLSPGALTFQHAKGPKCGTCHTAFDSGPAGWPRAAFGASSLLSDSRRCLDCHELGKDSLHPHNMPPARLAEVKSSAAGPSARAPQPHLWLAELVFDQPHRVDGTLACATCHREHDGRTFDLTAMSNQRCLACHTTRFASLAHGHPDFSGFPYQRRTRIFFHHVSHIGKHFRDEKFAERAPGECKDCHMPDVNGRTMLVAGFPQVCASCHAGQIDGTEVLGPKGVAVLGVPGLDLETLRERGAAIGGWPEYADGKITPLMDLLLSGDPRYTEAKPVLAEVDELYDLTGATEEQIAAVEALAWSVKSLLFELVTRGVTTLKRRVEQAVGRAVTSGEMVALAGLMSPDAVQAAQQEWFPELLGDVARHQAGLLVPMLGAEAEAAEASEPPVPASDPDAVILAGEEDILAGEDDILAEDDDILAGETDILAGEDDILAGEDDILSDDDLGSDEGPPSGAEDEAVEETVETVRPEDWPAAGGWYRQFFTLRYRPVGHADPFVKAWLDLSGALSGTQDDLAAHSIFNELSSPEAPGVCTKCHSVDAQPDDALRVNWRSAQPVPNEQRFTRFAHTAHFSLLDEKGCLTCHGLDSEADYAAGFEDRDPTSFASNFAPMDRAVCAGCHVPVDAGDSCLTCHNYHIGILPPAVVGTPGMMADDDT